MNAVALDYDDEIDQVLAYHRGNVREAIQALLKDRDFLVREIEYANLVAPPGSARGVRQAMLVQ